MNVFREADMIIGENYLHRWYIIPRNQFFNIYLHKFYHSDDDRALHDHPWGSVSFLLKGVLKEHLKQGEVRLISRFLPIFRSAKTAHRLELCSEVAITIFITGSKTRNWGFHCPNGWIPWQQFTDPSGTKIGKGCE